MAMTNSERQARWRARLKDQAAKNARMQDVFRDYMRALLQSEDRLAACADEDEAEIRRKATEALLAQSDEQLTEVLNALIFAWHDDECLTLTHARRRRRRQA